MLLASIQHGKYTDSYSDTMQLQLEASLVIMFEYGEYIKSDLLADVCQQLFNIRTCGGDGQYSYNTQANSLPLRVLVIVVQSTASEVDLYSNPSSFASTFITVNVLPTSLKAGSHHLPQCDPTSRMYLYDEYCKYAFNLKYTYAHIPYDLMCHINEQFTRLNHCVYSCVLQT